MTKYEDIVNKLIEEINAETTEKNKILFEDKASSSAAIIARATGVVSGLDICKELCKAVNKKLTLEVLKKNSEFVNRGDVIAVITGPIIDIFKVENIIVEVIKYMSGIASAVRKYKLELTDLPTNIMYEGHTVPTLDPLAKIAFIDGGGVVNEETDLVITNNTVSIYDDLNQIINILKAHDYKERRLVIAVNNKMEFEEAYLTKIHTIRIKSNNFKLIEELMEINRDEKKIEVEGEIELKKVRAVAKLGVSNLIIPSLSDGAKALNVELCFYKKRVSK